MLKKITILSLFACLIAFSTAFAQDSQFKKAARLGNLLESPKTLKSAVNGNGNGNHEVQALHTVLTSDGFYSPNAYAPVGTYRYERAVYLITPAEMALVGIPNGVSFSSIAWTYFNNASAPVTGSLKVYLQNTSDVVSTKGTTWSTNISGMTLVDNDPSFINPAAAYVIESLSNGASFSYGGGGLYVAFDYSNPGNALSTGTSVNVTTVLSNSNYWGQSDSSTNPTLLSQIARPETWLGFSISNDAQVKQVYTLGKLPIPYATPHKVDAVIHNGGDDPIYGLSVTLNITGANTYNEVKTIDTLLSGFDQDITFSNWTPTNSGINSVTVSVPPDQINVNNSVTVMQQINSNTYSNGYGPFPSAVDAGGGFSGATGDFVSKFYSSSASSVSQIGVNFTVGGQPYKLAIWSANGTGGIPGTLLWESAAMVSTPGAYNILISPKINVSGNFYVGVRQIGTTNLAFSYQIEDPVRSNTFYSAYPSGSNNWLDFASTNSTFRFLLNPALTVTNDIGPTTIDVPLGGSLNNVNTNLAPKATIANFGSGNQSSFNAYLIILDASNTPVYSSSKSLTLSAGSSSQVSFAATFNPTAQPYTAKCYTSLGTDSDRNNDTVSAAFSYGQFSMGLTALIQGFYNGSSMISDTATIELRDAASPYTLRASKKVILNTAGAATINNFNAQINNISPYYIVVKHRNAVETWSTAGNTFNSAGTLNYNFTTSASQAYGSNLTLKNTKYCMYSGDVNQDGIVDSGDLATVDNDNANYSSGYLATDVNGDGIIDSADLATVDNNNANYISKIVPSDAPGFVNKKARISDSANR